MLDLLPNGDISIVCYTVPAREVPELSSAIAHASAQSRSILANADLESARPANPIPANS